MKLSKRQLRRIIRKSMVETYDGEGRPNWDNEDKLRKAGKFDKSNISKADREEANAHIKYMEDLRKENERKREEIEKMRQERNARKGERYRHDLREEKQRLQELDFSGPAVGTDADVYGTPEQAEIEDALIACFCDWTTDGATARMSFNEFMLEVAEKLGVSSQSLAQSCERIRTGQI